MTVDQDPPERSKVPKDHILTPTDIRHAGGIGLSRHIAMLPASWEHGYKKDAGWDEDVEGACGEYAFALAMRLRWPARVSEGKKPNVAGLSVQTTKYIGTGCLIVRKDSLDIPQVLVVGKAPQYRVIGWFGKEEAMIPKFLRNPHHKSEAWFVPQKYLRDLSDLPPDSLRDRL